MSSSSSINVANTLVELLESYHDNPPMQWDVHFLSPTRADFRLITTTVGCETMSLAVLTCSWDDGTWRPLNVAQCAAPALVELFVTVSRQASLDHGIE